LELETMGNPPTADQALSVSGAADAFRQLNIGKPAEARAEEKPEATPEAVVQGDDPPDDTPPETTGDDTPPEPTFDEKAKRYRVKVDGVESQVSFEELRNGYQRHVDYQAKMRGVSEAQKAADAQRQAYLDRIQTVVPQLEAVLRGEFADIKDDADVARLADQEPARYVKWQAAMMRLDRARQEQQRAQYEAQQRQETQLKEYLAEQHKQLVERLPEWSDAEKGPKLKSELSSYLRNEGFAEQELGNLADHRLVLVARKAMLYDRAQRERAALAKQVNVPKVQKPGTTTKSNPNAEATQAAFDRLSKTGRVDDAANVFKGLKLFG
jgi:hypothetical protein